MYVIKQTIQKLRNNIINLRYFQYTIEKGSNYVHFG